MVLQPLLTEEREMRTAGAFYYGRDADEHYESVVVGDAYYGLIFVADANSAAPTRTESD